MQQKPVPHVELTELEKWELVNSAMSLEALQFAIRDVSDEEGNIKGKSNLWHYTSMQSKVQQVARGDNPRLLTRAYGIRRQAIAILASYSQTFKQLGHAVL